MACFQQFFGENQFVKTGDPGEKVLIKLNNYRFQKYGIIEGKVQNISLIPNDKGNYYVDVVLPKGLKTSYNKTLKFDKELRGNAEIVTQDLRLIERFFYQIRKLLGIKVKNEIKDFALILMYLYYLEQR